MNPSCTKYKRITEWLPNDEVTNTEYGKIKNRVWLDFEYCRIEPFAWVEIRTIAGRSALFTKRRGKEEYIKVNDR